MTAVVWVEAGGRRVQLLPDDPAWPEDWHAVCPCGWDSDQDSRGRADMAGAYERATGHLAHPCP